MSKPPANQLIWRWPVLLALLSATGLVSALLSDGLGDVWAWFSLAVPVSVATWYSFRKT